MQFHFTEEQEQFRDFLRRFIEDTTPVTEVRRLMETDEGYDRRTWQRLAEELSLPGLCIPEAHGGAGFGMVELGIAMEEMGRALLPSPFFATSVLAAKILEEVGTDKQQARYLPAIASGELTATLAWMDSADHAGVASLQIDGERLTAARRFVPDGHTADLLLVAGSEGEGYSVYLVEGNSDGVTRKPLATIDQTRRFAEIEFADAEATCLGESGKAGEGLARVLDLAYIALANESVGVAGRLFDDTLAYTKLRRQFGRTIASFQAIKHRMAELLLTVELAKSSAYYAAEAFDQADDESSMLASLAKAGASDACLQAGVESIQLHGGIGFTWENNTHLWFKRARGSHVLLGDPAWHRERVISELTGEAAA